MALREGPSPVRTRAAYSKCKIACMEWARPPLPGEEPATTGHPQVGGLALIVAASSPGELAELPLPGEERHLSSR